MATAPSSSATGQSEMPEGRSEPRRTETSTEPRLLRKASERPSPLVALARLLGRAAAEQALRKTKEER